MRKLLLIIAWLLAANAVIAQTTVTGTAVQDVNGNLYSNGTVSAFLVTPSGVLPRVNGVPLNPALGPFPTDATGSFSVTLTPNSAILPGGTQWQFTICGTSVNLGPQPLPLLQVCFNTALITVVSPGPQDITVQANAAAKLLGPAKGSGVGGSGCVGPGTVNDVMKWISSNGCGNSSGTDDGITPTRWPNGLNTAASGDHDEWTVDTGGVIASHAVCITASRAVSTCAAGATSGFVGIADATVAAGGTVSICWAARCNVITSNNATKGDWFIMSVSVAGDFDDVGPVKPTTTAQSFPVDSTVLAGALALTTLLSPDTLNAMVTGSGTINSCTLNGVAYYSGPGTSTIISCIPSPTSPNGVPQLFTSTPSGGVGQLPNWSLGGVPVNAQSGTNYTWLPTDRLKLITGSNALSTAWTGPALTANFSAAVWNLNAGLITFTPASGQVNGAASQIIPKNWFGFHYTDGASTFMPVMPTMMAFPNCSGALNFTSATGVFGCGSTGGSHGLSFTIGAPGSTTLSPVSTTTDYVTVPFACTISAYNLAIDAGTITVKFWKVATGTAIPTSGNSINTSGVGISSGTAIHSTTLSDFTTTTVNANDILAMNVTAATTAAYVNGVLSCQ